MLPLILSSGAGSASRFEIGIAMFGGMMAATFIERFFVRSSIIGFQLLEKDLAKNSRIRKETHMNKTSITLIATLGLFPAGCAIGPNYERPSLDVPKQYMNDKNDTVKSAQEAVSYRWWDSLGDAGLSGAVDSALKANYDIQSADAQIQLLLGQFDEEKSYLYPHIDAGGLTYTTKG